MVMELIRATSPELGGFSFLILSQAATGLPAVGQSLAPLSPTNHCSLFLNNTLNVVNDP